MSEQFTPWTYSEPVELKAEPLENQPRRRRSELYKRETKNIYRRAWSQSQLLDLFGLQEPQYWHSYHVISQGDIDLFSFLALILRHQNLDHVIISSWVYGGDDILYLGECLENGRISKLDVYTGVIFATSYRQEYATLKQTFEKYQPGRICIYRNHAKIIAGTGPRFPFVVESSANANTNPRAENSVLTVDLGLYQFYKTYFDDITTFEKEQREKDKQRRRNNGN